MDTEGAKAGTPAEENRAVVMRYIEEVWNRHDLDAIDGLVSSGYVNHAASTEEYRHGGARRIWEWILSVFPDHRFDVEDVAADSVSLMLRILAYSPKCVEGMFSEIRLQDPG